MIMKPGKSRFFLACILGIAILPAAIPIFAKYKPKQWTANAREKYPASLASEGVTIAVEALYSDVLAAAMFDKTDMVTRGFMPLAIVIFNDNDFPIEVDGLSIELIHGSDHLRTLTPNEAVYRLFRKDRSWLPKVTAASRSELNQDALDDFDGKFLMKKLVEPHDKGGGFLYFHIGDSEDPAAFIANSVVYIPNIYRKDDGSRMIFFEIEMKPAASIKSQK
jgi:hypothetical protein